MSQSIVTYIRNSLLARRFSHYLILPKIFSVRWAKVILGRLKQNVSCMRFQLIICLQLILIVFHSIAHVLYCILFYLIEFYCSLLLSSTAVQLCKGRFINLNIIDWFDRLIDCWYPLDCLHGFLDWSGSTMPICLLYLYQARLADWAIMFSTCPSGRPFMSFCEYDISKKTNKPILLPIGKSGRLNKGIKWSTKGQGHTSPKTDLGRVQQLSGLIGLSTGPIYFRPVSCRTAFIVIQ